MPMSTAGYAGLAAGEDWHYVGDTDEPAFGVGWDNAESAWFNLAFRIREAGVVDILGVVENTTDPTYSVFTLPSGYIPTNLVYAPCIGESTPTGGTTQACALRVDDLGQVNVLRVVSGSLAVPQLVYINAQIFLSPPVTP